MPSTDPIKIPIKAACRGDTRDPREHDIFTLGFNSRAPEQPRLKSNKTPNELSRICFSNDMAVASIFPPEIDNTWIYFLRVPETDDYDHYTQDNVLSTILSDQTKAQVRVSWSLYVQQRLAGAAISPMIGEFSDYLESLFCFLYGNEANTKRVLFSEIVGAVRCERKFLGAEVYDGGIFRLHEYLPNPHFQDAKIAQQTRNEISAMSYKWMQMPMPGNAFSNMKKETLDKLGAEPLFKIIMSNLQKKAEQRSKINNQAILAASTPCRVLDSVGFWCRKPSSEKKSTEKEIAIPANEVRANNVTLHTYKR
jgi:hypothetical protein